MNNKAAQKAIDDIMNKYKNGLYTVSGSMITIIQEIQCYTENIKDIDKRIMEENKLYKYAMGKMIKAIRYMDRVN